MKKRSNTVYSANELTRELCVSRTAIYAGLRAGTIPSIRLGRRFILPRAAILSWLQSAGGSITSTEQNSQTTVLRNANDI